MGRADFLKLGSWNFTCYRCGRKAKADTGKKVWQGFYVCDRPGCFEPRHPQDFVKGAPPDRLPPWVQPPPEDIFILFCTPNSRTAFPAVALPGCVIPGFIDPAYDPLITN